MDAAAATWWEAIAHRRLIVQRCADCDLVQHPPGPWCRTCRSDAALDWEPHSGSGRLLSFTQVHRSTYTNLEMPYWIAMVELSPGAVMVSNLVARDDGTHGEPRIGEAVRLTYQERDGRTLPVFALDQRQETP
jgi:uncharacterized OB-fold protein